MDGIKSALRRDRHEEILMVVSLSFAVITVEAREVFCFYETHGEDIYLV